MRPSQRRNGFFAGRRTTKLQIQFQTISDTNRYCDTASYMVASKKMKSTVITTDEQRKVINDQIDEGQPRSLPFDERNTGILNVLRCFELCWCDIERIRRKHGDAVAEVELDVATDALHQCLKWLSELVSNVESLKNLPHTTTENISQCAELIQAARRYAEMCDVMGILWLNKIETIEHSSGDIELQYTPEQMQYQAAQWLWRLERVPDVPFPDGVIKQLQLDVAKLSIKDVDFRVVTVIDPALIEALHQNVTDLSEPLWQLPKPLPLSSFTTFEFSRFWIALRTIVGVHKYIFNALEAVNVDAAIAVLKPDEWAELITRISGLDNDVVRCIINYLTYDYSLIKKTNDKKHKSEAMCFPFFRIGDKQLAASSLIVLNSNAERNLLDLASAKEGTTYDGVKKAKEEQWSLDLALRFKKFGLIAKPQVAYPGKPGGDIDLFVFDQNTKQALIVQLKWLLISRIKSGHIKEVNTAFEQSRRAISYIKVNTKDAAGRLGVSEADLRAAKFLPVAVMKESNLHGFATDLEIPILNSLMFDAVIEKTAGDLSELWQIISTDRSFMPQQGRDFVARRAYVPEDGKPFAGVRFTRLRLDLPSPGHKWTPFAK